MISGIWTEEGRKEPSERMRNCYENVLLQSYLQPRLEVCLRRPPFHATLDEVSAVTSNLPGTCSIR